MAQHTLLQHPTRDAGEPSNLEHCTNHQANGAVSTLLRLYFQRFS